MLIPPPLEMTGPNRNVRALLTTPCLQRRRVSLKNVLDEAGEINDYSISTLSLCLFNSV